MTERVIEMVGFQRFTRDKLGDDYDINGMRLRCKRNAITMLREDDYDVNGM